MEIVAVEGNGAIESVNDNALSQGQIQELRANREAHRYSQIWTKEPHVARGGYKKAGGSQGIDVFKQNLDGSEKRIELGYERVVVGPTTNFVGDAMTTGAVDMVQALLQFRRKVDGEDRGECGGVPPEGPRLLAGPEEVEAAEARARAIRDAVCYTSSASSAFPARSQQHKELRIVEWKEEDDRAIVLLERPYAEDVSCAMTLTTSFEQTGASIDFTISATKGRTETELKRYRRDINGLAYRLDVDRCRCLLGSGTLDELLSSADGGANDVKNRKLRVSHSDQATVICVVLHRDGETDGRARDGRDGDEGRRDGGAGSALRVLNPPGCGDELKSLKSFIRRSRRS